jgi:hypothetical protein
MAFNDFKSGRAEQNPGQQIADQRRLAEMHENHAADQGGQDDIGNSGKIAGMFHRGGKFSTAPLNLLSDWYS